MTLFIQISAIEPCGRNRFHRMAGERGARRRTGAQQPAIQMSDQVFKNVQILKGIPVDEFMGTMGLFSAALTVCCGDCHTGAGTSNPKWEDDPPKKRTARRMMQMVRRHQSRQLQRTAGRDVLDVSSRRASGRWPRRRSTRCTVSRRSSRPTSSRRRRPANRPPIRFSTSTFRRSAARRGWPA